MKIRKGDKKIKRGHVSKIFVIQSIRSAQYIFVNLINIFVF